jgi:light-regulated signal transduction histidine kinase (bacteriophytochrome)
VSEPVTNLSNPYTVDLTSCDREPVHHIGAIQPIGFLIAVTSEWQITHVSANAGDFLGLPIGGLLGVPLRNVFQPPAIHTIRNRLTVLSGPDAVERSFAVQLQDGGPNYDLAIHKVGELILIEAEPNVPTGDLNAGSMVRSMLGRIKTQDSLVREAARLMQALTGFDRVMIYRFHPDGSGEVIAERVRNGLEPFLGLRYPATDIPQQARALLLRNPVRVLVDVGAAPSWLVSSPEGEIDTPLDLSMSTLRAHSTMHVEYLQNMGVASTMTVSLVRDGTLWGLISCHHMSPRHVGFEQRTTAELFGELLSLLIEKRERAEASEYEDHSARLRQQLVATVVERGSAVQSASQLAESVADLLPCDGVALYLDGTLTLRGETPTESECEALRGFLDARKTNQVYAIAALGQAFPPAREFVDRAAGMLVLPISGSARDYLIFFRHELAHAVTWAGRPSKLLVVGAAGPRLSPRKSFAAWREIVRGQSSPWTPVELAAAEKMRVTLLEIVLQHAGEIEAENRASTQKQELLIAELNHRVRNILGLIRGLVAQSRMSAQDVDTFATVLGDRVHALARAHDQITAKNWGPGSLVSLIATEAAAFLGDTAVRVSFNGPPMLLQPQAFSTIALVIHELITNAAKHGALARETGQVAITWHLDVLENLILEWRETGGTKVIEPTRRGFGSTIIHRSVPHELGGEATVDFAPDGLHARFVIPARHAQRGEDGLVIETVADKEPSTGRLAGTVLLVEDNIIIALGAEDVLIELGADKVLVASGVGEALRLLAVQTPSFALLDINLGIEMSWPVASRLRELGVRYAFATGYGEDIEFPVEHAHASVIAKPYTKDAIARVLGGA